MLKILLKKELIQFRRNKFLPKLMFAFPVICMLIMPWIMQMDVQNIRISVIDPTDSSLFRRTRSHVEASPYFIYTQYPNHETAIRAMDNDELDVIITIPEDFERKMVNGTPDPILIESNGVNQMKGTQGMQYAMQTIVPLLGAAGADYVSTEFRYNHTQNARLYMTPALMIIVLLLICGFLPALNIVAEKENGTMEQINVMPIPKMTFILAKLIPYWVMGLLVFCLTMLLGWAVYGLSFVDGMAGFWLIMGIAVLFIMTMSAFSILVANISDTYQQAIFIMFFFLLCFMLLSGILTPISSMPKVIQYISMAFPPRYFIDVARSVYLKGGTFLMLWHDYLALFVMFIIFALLAIATYKKQQ